MRTGVLEGSTSPCPHCAGTGVIRSTESVALGVLRAIEDALQGGQKANLVISVSVAAALYILNAKRSYLRDIENRHGIIIEIRANERLHGANFTIERHAATPQPRRAQTAVPAPIGQTDVDYPDDDSGEPEVAETAEAAPTEREPEPAGETDESGDRQRGRRRRRGRGRGRGDRPENGHIREAGPIAGRDPDDAPASDEPEASQDPGEGEDGERPERADASGEDNGQRRRRRRGRRGGRRNRERREGDPPLPGDEDQPGLTGGSRLREARDDAPARDHESRGAEPAIADTAVYAASQSSFDNGRSSGPLELAALSPAEPAWSAPERAEPPRWQSAPEPSYAASSTVVERAAVLEPVVEVAEPEPEPPAPTGPPRRGWWQRKVQ
jgi:ribonuclease E